MGSVSKASKCHPPAMWEAACWDSLLGMQTVQGTTEPKDGVTQAPKDFTGALRPQACQSPDATSYSLVARMSFNGGLRARGGTGVGALFL